jgi:hypothetical protein
MINLNVIDKSGAAMYGNTNAVLTLRDDVKVERLTDGLALVEPSLHRKHIFNTEGEYTGTETTFTFGTGVSSLARRS